MSTTFSRITCMYRGESVILTLPVLTGKDDLLAYLTTLQTWTNTEVVQAEWVELLNANSQERTGKWNLQRRGVLTFDDPDDMQTYQAIIPAPINAAIEETMSGGLVMTKACANAMAAAMSRIVGKTVTFRHGKFL